MDDIRDLFAKAAELVKDLPEELRAPAFGRAVDLLTSGTRAGADPGSKRKSRTAARRKSSASAENVAKKKIGKVGGQTALRDLAGGDFLQTPRTVKAIIDHLATKKALKFKSGDLTSPLATLTRDGTLERQKNADGVYEYWASK